ncbi:MAG: hypothetical protein IJS01_15590 [Lentisphaeria bacterium]|nr:hypothetical protein [Lentisphaeria bacterium]
MTRDGNIRIAVWNLTGPPSGVHFTQTVLKINAFQRKFAPDIAFYLEAPEARCEFLPGVESDKWAASFWTGAEEGTPRGILCVKYQQPGHKDIRIEKFEVPDPRNPTALGIEVFYKEKAFLRVLGVWTLPDYMENLRGIVEKYRAFLTEKEESGVLGVMAGDTNVILSPGYDKDDRNRQEIEASLPGKLRIVDGNVGGPTLLKEGKWFRCDLLVASDERNLAKAVLGQRPKDKVTGGDFSDHLPIIFEVPVLRVEAGEK